MQKLFLKNITYCNLFYRILLWSKNLRYLTVSTTVDYDFQEEHLSEITYLPLKHLVEFHLYHEDAGTRFSRVTAILLHLAPDSLEHFSLHGSFSLRLPDGDEWREALDQLPRLHTFNLFGHAILYRGTESEYDLFNFYKSFASDWWVKEKKWFMVIIRVDLPATKSTYELTKIYVHSDPLNTDTRINLPLSSIKESLYTNPEHSSATNSYMAVKSIQCQSLDGLHSFFNLKYLVLRDSSRTITTTFSRISSFKYLKHITLSKINLINIDTLFVQLKAAARNLRSLTIDDRKVFECFLEQKTWHGIQNFELSILDIKNVDFIERLANILPHLRFLTLKFLKYDDYYQVLCDTLKYARNLVGFKTGFRRLNSDETNPVRTAFTEYLDELLLCHTTLDIETYKATFDDMNDTLTLWFWYIRVTPLSRILTRETE